MGLGADNGCECVGYQAHDPQGNEHPNLTLNRLVNSVRFTGGIGVVGVFVPQDPGGAGRAGQAGRGCLRLRRVLVPGPDAWAPVSAR